MASSIRTLTLRRPTSVPQPQLEPPQQHIQSNLTSSSTITQTVTQSYLTPVLRLRGASTGAESTSEKNESDSRHIKWDETVVNNEGMGKKKSKVCCIYHAPRAFGESSDESSSSSSDEDSCNSSYSSDDDRRNTRRGSSSFIHKNEENDPQRAGDSAYATKKRHHHQQHQSCDGGCSRDKNKNRQGSGRRKDKSPNAYERLPKSQIRHEGKAKT
ncbi:Type 1 phosphatases regulator YPI1 [Golovinomyces cichoracearum]|uniref:Type 1 phosphatases regulator n=1 Tax=Golovinomyces cichoracearum TaxID=62708 RepID=A0A420H941_9PEZI|nr:Type 1 phosphatases regulator YPI1 [Golovinomyces cichoracearum]